jgi:hypothetical protein
MPRCVVDPTCQDAIQQQPEEHRATMPSGPGEAASAPGWVQQKQKQQKHYQQHDAPLN